MGIFLMCNKLFSVGAVLHGRPGQPNEVAPTRKGQRMKSLNRRQFFKRSLTAAAGTYLGLSSLKVLPAHAASNEIRIAEE